ncbi:MAG TPA: hypothetical protein VGM03_16180 [Phycisphaerae bacterium]|jgi:hypothetical protein
MNPALSTSGRFRLAWIGLLVLALACIRLAAPTRRPQTAHTSANEHAATSRPISTERVMHGMAIQVDSNYQPVERYGALIREIAELGADTVLLSTNGYQERIDSTLIEIDPEKTPTDAQWLQLFDIAHRAGLRTLFMPKILLKDTRGGHWRGQIAPVSWDGWFTQYRRFMVERAKLAAAGGVEVFSIGSELISTEKFTDQWRETIRQVRDVFPGRLIYSSNWDHYTSIQFWDALDLVGMTTYYNLDRAGRGVPSVEALTAAWRPIRDEILEWQADIDRPLVFTEVGWCSQEGCSSQPWNYFLRDKCSPDGLTEQANNYEGFIRAWDGVEQVGGVIWWEWTPVPGGAEDHSYTPRGKPAEQRLREYFRPARHAPP